MYRRIVNLTAQKPPTFGPSTARSLYGIKNLLQQGGFKIAVSFMADQSFIDETMGGGNQSDDPAWSDKRPRPFYQQPLFLLLVALPTLLAVLYYGLLARDVYISESQFVVRSSLRAQVSPLGALLSSGGIAGPGEETNAVIAYAASRDAVRAIDRDGLVRRAYGPARAAWIDRFGGLFGGVSQEHLYQYFAGKVTIETDAVTQVTRLTVRAFDPVDAQKINRRLLEQSEGLVNRMSERARADAIAVAEKEVSDAKNSARQAAVSLSKFRNKWGIVDPKQEAEIRLQMISKLQDELIATRTQLQQMQTFTPRASQIPFLRSRQKSFEREIAEQSGLIAGGHRSLAGVAVRYQELWLEAELSEKLLAASVTSLEEARADARRKRTYVERVAEPSLPDYAMEPRRFRGMLAALLLSLLAWGIIATLRAGIQEHRD